MKLEEQNPGHADQSPQEQIAQLQQRLAELEAQLAQQAGSPAAAAPPPPPTSAGELLFVRTLASTDTRAVVLTDMDGTITETNPTFARLYGYAGDEPAVLQQPFASLLTPDEHHRMTTVLQYLHEHGFWEGAMRHVQQDGSSLAVYVTSFAFRGPDNTPAGLVFFCRDIRAETQQAEALRASEAQGYWRETTLQTLLEATPDIVTSTDLEGNVQWHNPAIFDVLGFRPEERIGRSLLEWVHPEEKQLVYQTGLSVASGQFDVRRVRFRLMHAEGRWLVMESQVRLIRDQQQRPASLVMVTRDITEQVQHESELETLREQAENAGRARDQFLAMMSHELRTPLNTILGLSEALLEEVYGPLAPRQQQAIALAHESGQRLLIIVNDILNLTRLETGQMGLNMLPVMIEDLAQHSIQAVWEEARARRLRVTTRIDSSVTMIMIDEMLIAQALKKLLENAVKFTPEEGAIGLEVQANPDQGMIFLIVWDTGIGIAPEKLSHLFQPFVQIDGSLQRPFEGTGLGLAIAHRIAELHGGSIDVQSTPGQGSRFTLALPLLVPTESDNDSEQAAQAARPREAAPASTILLVEDNELNSMTISDYLQQKGYTVVVARDGMQALAVAQDTHLDLILTDLQLPVLDGLELIRRVRAMPALATVPIIVLTAQSTGDNEQRCVQAGASAYLTKPLSLRELLQTIEGYLLPRSKPSKPSKLSYESKEKLT